ncbi:hypothetical protein TcCL_ESM05426 [Trypanosoma cruzi]|nr:hypothetical protein TcCL_ESM05426 [Trypanosoma cruzi]
MRPHRARQLTTHRSASYVVHRRQARRQRRLFTSNIRVGQSHTCRRRFGGIWRGVGVVLWTKRHLRRPDSAAASASRTNTGKLRQFASTKPRVLVAIPAHSVASPSLLPAHGRTKDVPPIEKRHAIGPSASRGSSNRGLKTHCVTTPSPQGGAASPSTSSADCSSRTLDTAKKQSSSVPPKKEALAKTQKCAAASRPHLATPRQYRQTHHVPATREAADTKT